MRGLLGQVRDGRGALRALAALLVALGLAAASAAGAQAATLSGTISSQTEGDPFVALAGATVSIKEPGSGTLVASTSSDLLGAYSASVPDGAYDVEVAATGYESLTRSAVDLGSDRELDETLVETGHGRVHGIVRDGDGRPIPGVSVLLGSGGGAIGTQAGADGRYSLAAPQSVTGRALRIRDAITSPQWAFEGTVPTLGGEREIDLTLPPRHELTVRVLGMGDVPLADVFVQTPRFWRSHDLGGGVTGQVYSEGRSGLNDAAGEFRVLALEGGVARGFGSRIGIYPTAESLYEQMSTTAPAIDGPAQVVLRPTRVGRLYVELRTSGGRLLSGAAWLDDDTDGNPFGNAFNFSEPEGTSAVLNIVPGYIPTPPATTPWTFVGEPFELVGQTNEIFRLPAYQLSPVRVVDEWGYRIEGAVVRSPETVVDPGLVAIRGTLRMRSETATTDNAGLVDVQTFTGARSDPAAPGAVQPPPGSGLLPASFTIPRPGTSTTVVLESAPEIELDVTPAPTGDAGWWSVNSVAVSVTATDADIATLACTVDGVARRFAQTRTVTEISGSFNVSGSGRHTVSCTAADDFGNASEGQRVIGIDRGNPFAPSATADRAPDSGNGWFRDGVTVAFADNGDPLLADGSAGSGVDPASVRAPQSYGVSGTFVARGTVADRSGRVSAVGKVTVKVDADVPASTLTCPASPVGLGAVAYARWVDADGQSGLTGTARGRVLLDTSTVGEQVAEHTAVDRVGHRTTSSCRYAVA